MDVESLFDRRHQIGFVVAVFFGFFIKRRFFRSKHAEKWKKPFTQDTRRPVTAMETDHEKRNEILKKGK